MIPQKQLKTLGMIILILLILLFFGIFIALAVGAVDEPNAESVFPIVIWTKKVKTCKYELGLFGCPTTEKVVLYQPSDHSCALLNHVDPEFYVSLPTQQSKVIDTAIHPTQPLVALLLSSRFCIEFNLLGEELSRIQVDDNTVGISYWSDSNQLILLQKHRLIVDKREIFTFLTSVAEQICVRKSSALIATNLGLISFNLQTNSQLFHLSPFPHEALCLSMDGSKAYVANKRSVSVIDAIDGTLLRSVHFESIGLILSLDSNNSLCTVVGSKASLVFNADFKDKLQQIENACAVRVFGRSLLVIKSGEIKSVAT